MFFKRAVEVVLEVSLEGHVEPGNQLFYTVDFVFSLPSFLSDRFFKPESTCGS